MGRHSFYRSLPFYVCFLCALSLISFSSTANALPGKFTKLIMLGHEIENFALETNESFQQSYFHYLQTVRLNSVNGYLGPKQNPFLDYNEATSQIVAFMQYVDLNFQTIRQSNEERSDIIYALLGSGYALKAASLNLIDSKEVSFLKRKIYEKNCFRFGSSEGTVGNLSRFLWILDCYEETDGSYDEANVAVNELFLATNAAPALKEKAFSIGTDFAWRAARKNLNDVNFFSFTPNSYIENKISLLNRVIYLATETKSHIAQYEALKALRELYQKVQNEKELNAVEKKMVELLRREKRISWLQEFTFSIRWLYPYLIFLIVLAFPTITFLALFRSKRPASQMLYEFSKFLVGVEVEQYAWQWKILRTAWLFMIGLATSLVISAFSLNLSGFTFL